MKLVRTVQFNPALVALVPLVTVLFLLVLFFTLSSRYVLQPGIAATLPYSPFVLGPQRNAQILSITALPVPTIYFRDQKFSMAELEKALESGLFRSKLMEKERGRSGGAGKSAGRDLTLVIKADRSTPYELVVRVMNLGLQKGYSVVLATSEEPRS